MAKNYIGNLSDKEIFDFVNSHFMTKIVEQDFNAFLDKNIIKYKDSQGYHVEVYFECDDYKDFYACIELTNYHCIVHDKNDYPMYKDEDKKFYRLSPNKTTEKSTLLDYRKLMLKKGDKEYAKKLSQVLIREIVGLNRHPKAGTARISTMRKELCENYTELFGVAPVIPKNVSASEIAVD